MDAEVKKKAVRIMRAVEKRNTGMFSEILWVQFPATAIKRISPYSKSHKLFGFPVHINVIFTQYFSLLSVFKKHFV